MTLNKGSLSIQRAPVGETVTRDSIEFCVENIKIISSLTRFTKDQNLTEKVSGLMMGVKSSTVYFFHPLHSFFFHHLNHTTMRNNYFKNLTNPSFLLATWPQKKIYSNQIHFRSRLKRARLLIVVDYIGWLPSRKHRHTVTLLRCFKKQLTLYNSANITQIPVKNIR